MLQHRCGLCDRAACTVSLSSVNSVHHGLRHGYSAVHQSQAGTTPSRTSLYRVLATGIRQEAQIIVQLMGMVQGPGLRVHETAEIQEFSNL